MTYLSRPPRRGPTPGLCAGKSSTDKRPEIVRVEYTVFTKADVGLTWKIFSDWKLWPSFSDVYGKGGIEWRGAPWEPGSRLFIDIAYPVRTTVDRVITICTPPRCVAWISHVRGFTMEQWVLFDPYHGGGTKISTWIELMGVEFCVDGCDAREIVKGMLAKWFEEFCAECDRIADGR